MNFYEGIETQSWVENENVVKIKNEKVIVKVKRDDKLLKSCIMPTDYFPTNTIPEIFTYKNTEMIEDETLKSYIDEIPYYVGRCYTNADNVTRHLKEKGYDTIFYSGWCFTEEGVLPIYHCWTIVRNNGKVYMIDLCDEDALLQYNLALMQKEQNIDFENMSKEEWRELYVSFKKQIKENNIPNQKRILNLGQVHFSRLYVGSENDIKGARREFNNLISNYPNHICQEDVGNDRLSETQRKMREAGLM